MKDVLNKKQYKFLKYTLCALFVIAFLFFLSEFNINAAPKEEKDPKELLRVEQLDASYNDLASVLNTTYYLIIHHKNTKYCILKT